MTKVTFIGAGNLATNLAKEMCKQGFALQQIYSYREESAKQLADSLGCAYTNNLNDINSTSDLYIFAVKDAVLAEVVAKMPANAGIWVHTAGSIPATVFEGYAQRYGVFYPLQTFSKERRVEFCKIPFFIESNAEATTELLISYAQQLSEKVYRASSDQRKYLHLSAVFACNFSNHMVAIAQEILQSQNLPFDAITPLIEETTRKIEQIPAIQAQTGPAVRYDQNVMNNHVAMLQDEKLQEIYKLISENIHNYTKK